MHDRWARVDRSGIDSLRLEEALIANGVIDAQQLQEVFKRHPSNRCLLVELLLDLEVISPDRLPEVLNAGHRDEVKLDWLLDF